MRKTDHGNIDDNPKFFLYCFLALLHNSWPLIPCGSGYENCVLEVSQPFVINHCHVNLTSSFKVNASTKIDSRVHFNEVGKWSCLAKISSIT